MVAATAAATVSSKLGGGAVLPQATKHKPRIKTVKTTKINLITSPSIFLAPTKRHDQKCGRLLFPRPFILTVLAEV
jgi:hypothetical protein